MYRQPLISLSFCKDSMFGVFKYDFQDILFIPSNASFSMIFLYNFPASGPPHFLEQCLTVSKGILSKNICLGKLLFLLQLNF